MLRKKHSEEQIVFLLKQVENGAKVLEVCRKPEVTEQSFYRWKKHYQNLGVSELRDLRQLREENTRLKQLVADLSLDKQILQEVLSKKV
jgi:putative transposase